MLEVAHPPSLIGGPVFSGLRGAQASWDHVRGERERGADVPGESSADVVEQKQRLVLIDPGWDQCDLDRSPPEHLVVGGWDIVDGVAGPFRPNRGYRPSASNVPTDPIDAILRTIVTGGQLGAELVAAIRNSIVEIGCDEENRPILGAAVDGISCVVVVTAEVQKALIDVDRWIPVRGHILPEIVPPDTDVLLNPEGAAPFRLCTEILCADAET